MKAFLTIRTALTAGVVVVLCALAWWGAPDADHPAGPGPWYSILPPLLAVTLAVVTGRILFSLVFAIVVGGLLNTIPAAPLQPIAYFEGVQNAFYFVWVSVTDPTNLQILVFITLVLSVVAVMIVAGGLHGIVLRLERFARTRRSTQMVTFIMGLIVFIDDYANTMLVGASMRPVTDRHRISREKLSFLVDATSAPVAGLAIVSTWVGYEVGLFSEAAAEYNLDTTGYAMLFNALPFRFYCVMMLMFVAVNIWSGKDFGPMRKAELRAIETGELAAPDAVPMTSQAYQTAEPDATARISAATGLIPIIALFGILLGSIWWDGGGFAVLAEDPFALFKFAAWRDVISASENSILLLAVSAAIALVIAWVLSLALARVPAQSVARATVSGARSSLLPIVILVLAWSIKEACNSLGTGPFLVAALGGSIGPAWFPAVTFIVASLTSFSIGTSYGTMAILMPTAVPIALSLEGGYGPITMITLAAILDGAILGDHCSPISDTTIMSSISSSADHMHHVRTQLPYSIAVGALAVVCGYVPAGFGWPGWMGMGLGLVVIVVGFVALRSGRQPRRVKPIAEV